MDSYNWSFITLASFEQVVSRFFELLPNQSFYYLFHFIWRNLKIKWLRAEVLGFRYQILAIAFIGRKCCHSGIIFADWYYWLPSVFYCHLSVFIELDKRGLRTHLCTIISFVYLINLIEISRCDGRRPWGLIFNFRNSLSEVPYEGVLWSKC